MSFVTEIAKAPDKDNMGWTRNITSIPRSILTTLILIGSQISRIDEICGGHYWMQGEIDLFTLEQTKKNY